MAQPLTRPAIKLSYGFGASSLLDLRLAYRCKARPWHAPPAAWGPWNPETSRGPGRGNPVRLALIRGKTAAQLWRGQQLGRVVSAILQKRNGPVHEGKLGGDVRGRSSELWTGPAAMVSIHTHQWGAVLEALWPGCEIDCRLLQIALNRRQPLEIHQGSGDIEVKHALRRRC